MLTLILPFFVLVRTVFRHSHGFHLLLVDARIQQFSGAHIESTIFRYWSGQFFGTRTDSSFSRYSPGFNNFLVVTLILPFFVLVRTVFRHSHEFHLLLESPGFNNFLALTLNLPFFGTGPDSFSVLARIPPFPGTRPESTIFWCSH